MFNSWALFLILSRGILSLFYGCCIFADLAFIRSHCISFVSWILCFFLCHFFLFILFLLLHSAWAFLTLNYLQSLVVHFYLLMGQWSTGRLAAGMGPCPQDELTVTWRPLQGRMQRSLVWGADTHSAYHRAPQIVYSTFLDKNLSTFYLAARLAVYGSMEPIVSYICFELLSFCSFSLLSHYIWRFLCSWVGQRSPLSPWSSSWEASPPAASTTTPLRVSLQKLSKSVVR